MANNRLRDYKKVRQEGGSRVLAIGEYIPKDWLIVKVVKEDEKPGKWVRLRIEKTA